MRHRRPPRNAKENSKRTERARAEGGESDASTDQQVGISRYDH
jgi:hypothetical protein